MTQLAQANPLALLSGHLTVGCSTGFMEDARGDWLSLVDEAAAAFSSAIELSALSETELPGLLEYLNGAPQFPFRYVSVHAPSKGRRLGEPELVELLRRIPLWADAVVLHPDTVVEPDCYRALGRRLVLENMDARKSRGRTADELAELLEELPEAGLCLDLAHAKDVDPSLAVAEELLDRFGPRLRHVHLSSLDAAGHHVPLTAEDEDLFRPLLERCRDVPWILEAPPRTS